MCIAALFENMDNLNRGIVWISQYKNTGVISAESGRNNVLLKVISGLRLALNRAGSVLKLFLLIKVNCNKTYGRRIYQVSWNVKTWLPIKYFILVMFGLNRKNENCWSITFWISIHINTSCWTQLLYQSYKKRQATTNQW